MVTWLDKKITIAANRRDERECSIWTRNGTKWELIVHVGEWMGKERVHVIPPHTHSTFASANMDLQLLVLHVVKKERVELFVSPNMQERC